MIFPLNTVGKTITNGINNQRIEISLLRNPSNKWMKEEILVMNGAF